MEILNGIGKMYMTLFGFMIYAVSFVVFVWVVLIVWWKLLGIKYKITKKYEDRKWEKKVKKKNREVEKKRSEAVKQSGNVGEIVSEETRVGGKGIGVRKIRKMGDDGKIYWERVK